MFRMCLTENASDSLMKIHKICKWKMYEKCVVSERVRGADSLELEIEIKEILFKVTII